MFAQVTRLQYWKSEHDEQTCEDAYGESVTDGLFAVADGAGTTLFSNIWAKILGSGSHENVRPFKIRAMEKQVQTSIMHQKRFGEGERLANKTS